MAINQNQRFDGQGKGKPSQPFFLDLVTLEKLFFQAIPDDLDYQPEAGWQAIVTPGRNNPFYQYTGGEDTLVFSISWYSDEVSRDDVLKKTKWLESLTRNDGYDGPPHHISLCFGDMFKDSKWIVFSAMSKYKLFNREVGMLPQLAVTEVTLKRITTTNSKRSTILNIST